MQNYKSHIKILDSIPLSGVNFTMDLFHVLNKFRKNLYLNPPREEQNGYLEWVLPYDKPLKDKYRDILYIFAKVVRVKLMWREIIPREGIIGETKTKQAIWVMGDFGRVNIWIALANNYFMGYFTYHDYIRKFHREKAKQAGYADIRLYSSKLLTIQRDTTYVYLKNALEYDHAYELGLENWIMGAFKLDYKKYRTDTPEYDHAISTKFHHKRMIL